MRLVTKREQLPPMPRTNDRTLYKGHLPVIVFTVEEHRDYESNRGGWKGFEEAGELARAHFAADAACQRVEMIFLNDPDDPHADTEASYAGAFKREQFEPGGKYAKKASKKRCVCAAMAARTAPTSTEAWDCEYHGSVRAGVANPYVCRQQESEGKLVQVGVTAVEFFETEGGGCRNVVVMDGGQLAEFPHAAHLAVRCTKGDDPRMHPHAPVNMALRATSAK